MKVTIREVAEAANVSRGTVDRALHHRPGVNAHVAERIIAIAEEMGYKPDMTARSLASKKYIKKIGVLLCSEGNPFFDEVIQGVEYALKETEHLGIRGCVKTMKGFNLELQLKKIEELRQEKISGLVITPVNSLEVARKIQELEDEQIPVATINTDVALNMKHFLYVGCDYVKSGRVAGGLLRMFGSGQEERVAIIIGSKMVMAQAQRLEGIEEVLRESCVRVEAVLENDDDDQKSYNLMKKLLLENRNLTAICFASAGVQGGVQAINEANYERKLRIMTFDLTDVVRRNLENDVITATVCQEPYQQGFLGVDILARYLVYGVMPEQSVVNTRIFITTKYNL